MKELITEFAQEGLTVATVLLTWGATTKIRERLNPSNVDIYEFGFPTIELAEKTSELVELFEGESITVNVKR